MGGNVMVEEEVRGRFRVDSKEKKTNRSDRDKDRTEEDEWDLLVLSVVFLFFDKQWRMMDEIKRETSEGDGLASLEASNKELMSSLHSSLPPSPSAVSYYVFTVCVCLCVSCLMLLWMKILLRSKCQLTFEDTNEKPVYPLRLPENLSLFLVHSYM